MDVHLVDLSRSIDLTELGHRVRRLRLAVGLKQSDLAGSEVTAAYISRIEAGQRRPGTDVLELLAERLSTSVRELLEGDGGASTHTVAPEKLRLELDYVELALMSGDAAGALTKLGPLLPELEATGDLTASRQALHLKAGALEATGDAFEAIRLLEALVEESVPDVQWVKSVIALSRCYRETGEFGRAAAVGERAVKSLDELGLSETTEAVQLTVTIAGAYMERGDLEYALRLCLEGVEQGDRIASPVAQGSAYWNASVVESMRGNAGAALRLAQRAMAYFQIGDDSRNLGRLRTEIAILQLRVDPPDALAARDTLTQARQELSWAATSQFDRADHHLASGRASLLLDDLEMAQADLASAIELSAGQSPVLLAEAQLLTGQISAAGGDLQGARGWYRRAIATLAGVGADRDVTRLWFELAAVLEAAGDATGALDAYKRGATSTGLASAEQVARSMTNS